MLATLGVIVGLGVAVGLGVTVGLGVAEVVAWVRGVGLGEAARTALPVARDAAEQVSEVGLAGFRQELLMQERPMLQSLSVKQAASQDTAVAPVVPVGAAARAALGEAAWAMVGPITKVWESAEIRVSAVVPVRLARVFWVLKLKVTVPAVVGVKVTEATLTGEVLENGVAAFCVIMAKRITWVVP